MSLPFVLKRQKANNVSANLFMTISMPDSRVDGIDNHFQEKPCFSFISFAENWIKLKWVHEV